MIETKKRDYLFWALFLGIGAVLFWRCFYSVNTTDEAYYIGTVYRLWFGDGMLCDEWNPTQQMCSFWLYPFYALFRMILGSNEGMILAFRLLYIAFQLLIGYYLYRKLKGFGKAGYFPVYFYLLSTAFNINSLSYNTMANSALTAFLVTLMTMEKADVKNSLACGVFASIVVMGNPYAVAAYVLYGVICAAVSYVCRKSGKELPEAMRFKTFMKMSLTAAGVLVIFLLFTLWHATPERIMKNLPYIIGDQEHVQRWGVKISSYFGYFTKHYLDCTVVPLFVSAVAVFDKNRVGHGKIYMGLAALSVVPYMIYHGLISDYVPVNLVTVPVCFLGLTAYAVSEKKRHKIFGYWYVPSMIYPFIVQITSNTGPLAVSAAFVSAGAASVLLVLLWAEEQNKKLWRRLAYGIVCLQLLMMLWLRVTYVWADAPLPELTARVERGAAKGLYTTEETAQYYEELYDDIDAMQLREDDGLLIVGSEPLLYLYADRQVASYSTWQVYTNETRLYRYYEIHSGEGKFPSAVYCVEADESIFDSILVDGLLLPMGYTWERLEHGIAFYSER